jgi:hypothetical protein
MKAEVKSAGPCKAVQIPPLVGRPDQSKGAVRTLSGCLEESVLAMNVASDRFPV